MKKVLFGVLAGVGLAGLAGYLHRQHKKNLVTSVKGVVTEIGDHAFQIEAYSEGGQVIQFHISPFTKFIWLANSEGGSNVGHFSDLTLNARVSVVFVKKEGKPIQHAERVIIEAVK